MSTDGYPTKYPRVELALSEEVTEEVMHEHLCLAIHERNFDSLDWLASHVEDILMVKAVM